MADCYSPLTIEHGAKRSDVPCGKCVACLKKRVSGWSYRLQKEERRSNSAFFITLTYNTENVPLTKNGYMTLSKEDVQKFFKRLRKLQANREMDSCIVCNGVKKICKEVKSRNAELCNMTKISYYLVGEYGSKTKRPHYHMIIYGADILEVEKAWKLDGKELGNIHCGSVSGASVGYTLKYIHKEKMVDPVTGRKEYKIGSAKNDDRLEEFSLMSKGIGKNYVNERTIAWHKADLLNRYYLPYEGKKLPLPKYYRKLIYNDEELKLIQKHMKKIKREEEENLTLEEYREEEKKKIEETRRYIKNGKEDKI